MIAGVQDAQQLVNDLDDGVGARDAVHVEVVDDPSLVIVGDDVVDDTGNGFFNEVLHGGTALSSKSYS